MAKLFTSWPFKEAERIIKARSRDTAKAPALFQTGFGPSGLPHIGTFAEVARTTWIRRAYEYLTGETTRLVAFCDDQDGLRKVPDNLPNREMAASHLGKPLCDIPDPYGCCESFSAHMIGNLRNFLNTFHFDYELRQSSDAYRQGDFNEGLAVLLDKVEGILDIILPTMKEENRGTWSPFFPKCEACGRINTTRVTAYHKEARTIDYTCDLDLSNVKGCGHAGVSSVLNGASKMGWKIDWALRWYCYKVDYEMYGKDLIPSAELSEKIVHLMGGRPPQGLFYELFLDENGEKISKSKGNGVSIEQWLEYAPIDSLAHFIFREPRQAKKLYFDMIPKTMDEYLDQIRRWPEIPEDKRPDSPLWHIHDRGTKVPVYRSSINFTTVNNLVSALGRPNRDLLLSYLSRYDAKSAEDIEVTDSLIEKGLKFYEDHILPKKQYRPPTDKEKPLFHHLADTLKAEGMKDRTEQELQSLIFDIARENGVEPKDFFSAFYQVLLGQERGPRFGSFAKLVGIDRVLKLISERAGLQPLKTL